MAIPSGTGTEVLKRSIMNAASNTATAFRWDGTMATTGTSTYTVPANHIITVISIIFSEQGGAAESISLLMNDGTNNISLMDETIPSYGAFVWNDKFVLTGGDKLISHLQTAGSCDIILSYIDQDWS